MPLEEVKKGFYSRYFLVPKKTGVIGPILDLRILNKTLVKRKFRMLTFQNAGFHKVRRSGHRPVTGLSLFNYLDDWLICSRSEEAAKQDCHLVVSHLHRLGFVVNRGKSALSPSQTAHFLGMTLDSTSMTVGLSRERIRAISLCVNQFRLRQRVSSLLCQRLLGMMASAAIALPLGMLHMRPFQMWYLSLKLSSARNSYQRVTVDSRCRKALAIWRMPQFFIAAAPMGIVTRRVVVTTDASTMGWGAHRAVVVKLEVGKL